MNDVVQAFSGLVVSQDRLMQLGEAMNKGRALFLYGSAGNGKSSVAEALVRAFDKSIWIPRAITVGGEIIRLYDPIHHEELPIDDGDSRYELVDRRWVRIRRPTLQVGGELELSDLDITTNPVTGINEAPIQMKSNCGVLIFDDFGRNRFRPAELLNRLIVPLEKQQDTLHLASGRTFRVPYDSMVVFSTNLDPLSLVDEAFLRRVPYCVHITDPTDEEFREVFRADAQKLAIEYSDEHLDYLIDHHYRECHRPMRFCHPRDILEHIQNAANFQGKKPRVTREGIDRAVQNLLSLRSEVAAGV
jgi:predicted ATPase with chaperone activity